MSDKQLKLPVGDEVRSSRLGRFDSRLFVALRTHGHPRPLELLVAAFSITGNYGLFWLGFSAMFWLSGAEDAPGIFVLMPLILYPTLLANFIIKVVLRRERPRHAREELKPLVGVPSSMSFPSSHAAMSFAAAVLMTYFNKSLWPLFFGLAFVMSWSRVYVGVHYPSDVLAGTGVGLIMGGLILWLMT